MGISLVKFVSHIFWIHDQHSHKPTSFNTQILYQNGLFIKWFFDGRPFSTLIYYGAVFYLYQENKFGGKSK